MNKTCLLYLPAFVIVVWAVLAELIKLSQPVTGFALFTIAVAMKIQIDESVRKYRVRKVNGDPLKAQGERAQRESRR